MQISSSDQTNRNDAIQFLLIDLDGTCYDIGNKYEDHVRYPECTNKAQSTSEHFAFIHMSVLQSHQGYGSPYTHGGSLWEMTLFLYGQEQSVEVHEHTPRRPS